MSVLVLLVSFLVTIVLLPYIDSMLRSSGAVKENYLGINIPVGMGIIFIPAVIIGSVLLIFFTNVEKELILINMLGITVMGFAGIIDDMLGNREVLGFKGHIKSLAKGTLTTGGFKALIGGLIAAAISLFVSGTVIEWIVNTLIIALFTNALNLMDLRPGRSIKFFFFVWGFSFIAGINGIFSILLFPLAGSLLAYMPVDFKGKGMMGDAGSNILGFSMGLYYTFETMLWGKLFVLVALILLHIIGEKYSFTMIIGRNRILNFIDGLGTANGKGGRSK